MEPARARAVLRALHDAQGGFYAGGPDDGLRALLVDDIAWHVPGDNAIAGDYRGREAVMDYFAARRDLAGGTFRMHPGEVLLGDGDHVAVLTDGTAVVAGREWRWSTVGLYRLRGAQVAACWLLALDQAAFDAVWRALSPAWVGWPGGLPGRLARRPSAGASRPSRPRGLWPFGKT